MMENIELNKAVCDLKDFRPYCKYQSDIRTPRVGEAIDIVLAELERLQAEREKLPITADGVLIYPGMKVWIDRENQCIVINTIEEDCVTDNCLDAYAFDDLYSTQQAAISVKEHE